jgi:hypothetical protein
VDVATWEAEMADLIQEEAMEAPYKIFKQGDQYVVKNNAGMV